jgi:hypothetical protein
VPAAAGEETASGSPAAQPAPEQGSTS